MRILFSFILLISVASSMEVPDNEGLFSPWENKILNSADEKYIFNQNFQERDRDKRDIGTCIPKNIPNGKALCDSKLTNWTVSCNDFYHVVGPSVISYPAGGSFPTTTTCEADDVYDMWPILLAIFIFLGLVIFLLIVTALFWFCHPKKQQQRQYKAMNEGTDVPNRPDLIST